MKNFIITPALAIFILLISACSNIPNAIIDFNQNVNFQAFKSFQYANDFSVPHGKNPFRKSRIKKAITHNLAMKNMMLIVQENKLTKVDLIISIHISQQTLTNDSSLSIGIGSIKINRNSGINIGISTDIPLNGNNTTLTKITIDMSHKNETIWHGSNSYQGSDNMTMKEKDSAVTKAVNKLLADFPPNK